MISEFIYMLPSNMNLWIEKIENYNNETLISKPGFSLGTNSKINLDGERDKPDVKPKKEPDIKSNKEQIQDIKPNIDFKKEDKQDVKMIKTKPGMDKITYEEEKVALVLGITSIFTVWWIFKWLIFSLSLSWNMCMLRLQLLLWAPTNSEITNQLPP